MDSVLNSKLGLQLALAIARTTPPRLGYVITRLLVNMITLRKESILLQTIRLNQQKVSGNSLNNAELDQAAKKVLLNSSRSIYDLYHYLEDLDSNHDKFFIDPSFQHLIEHSKSNTQGIVIGGVHMMGFDLLFQWLVPEFLDPLALTIPNPEGGRALEFQRRVEMGIRLVPGSYKGLRQAIRYLEQGGIVVTGIDHPSEMFRPRLDFFGAPASLPSHHIFLALKAKCPVVVAASYLGEDGRYHLTASSPIDMEMLPDREDQLKFNGEKVLAAAESIIREHPQQWLVFQPVWGSENG